MPMPSGKAIKTLINSVVKAIPKKDARAANLAPEILANVALEDLQALTTDCLAEITVSGHKAFSAKSGRTLKVEQLGSDKTLVTLTMGNRPFIVDSVLVELSQHQQDILFVSHPLLESPTRGRTSLMLVVLSKTTTDQRADIKRGLKEVLNQVRLVTDDWQNMLARIGEKVAEFRTNPPPVPAEELAEAVQFLEWLSNDNFTLLGLREYTFEGNRKSGQIKPVKGSALGILRDDDLAVMTRGGEPVVLTPEIRDFLFRPDPLIITKANARSRVHRRVHLDYIGIKRYSKDGKLAGELRVVGLFTSTAYTKSVMTIPVLRHKVSAVLEDFDVDRKSHTGKALINVMETWPRDEMFQLDQNLLAEFSDIAIKLDERPRVRVLPRPDKFDRFVSVMMFVPRDRYDSDVRRNVGAYLEKIYDGYLSAFYPAFLENSLTRVHFIIGRSGGKTPEISSDQLEQDVRAMVQTWGDRLIEHGGAETPRHTFPIAYQQSTLPQNALEDSKLLESLEDETSIALDFHDVENSNKGYIGLKLFHLVSSIPLSQRVPLLENLGFQVIEEITFEIERDDGNTVFVHDMLLRTNSHTVVNRKDLDQPLIEAIAAIWNGHADNDNFNALILMSGLDWKTTSVFRAVARYLRQVRSRFTVHSMARTLANYPDVTRDLSTYFTLRFDPDVKSRDKKMKDKRSDITSAIENISSSDDDRIVRNFLNVMDATLRTNFYSDILTKPGTENTPTPVLAFKVDPSAIAIMPQPVPYREIFVSSPRLEGLHLRFGPVARGGLRWSDRAQDYRTEVLGLVKAQQVKNAVIVPVGSKGGFVPKQLPDPSIDRNAWFEEGRGAYKTFISSLLSLTDNLVDGKVVPPKQIVRHDGDDPYFVVAADKGTSTFSDTANVISQDYDFWLDDAFASGGSAGYDHKKMGITARGAWEAVKRHFREMEQDGKSWDIQSTSFTVAGVGDMSGDVFGNGMLLSKQTRLIAAFDHRDIFIDPNPDIISSFKERKRLFDAGRSSWKDYKTDLISKGGGVFPRSAKSITLTKPAADAIGLETGNHSPQTVMNAILKMEIDLMWFGGIGTYIRASHESDVDAGDRSNDAIRVTAKELRCKVIGEGANLGVTQRGRIEFNTLGGRCNSDAIDNSAGVNSSDVEVNIKIALAAAMKSGKLSRAKRNTLLESMTETVAELVLRNNYLQTLSISLTERRGMEDLPHQQRLMQNLEGRNKLDRAVEDLPDDIVLSERQAAGEPLTRAEMGVLLAYAKIVALDDIVDSKLPDDPYLNSMLVDYFPPKMQKTYVKEINQHRLRREIIGTVVVNSMINRGGSTMIARAKDRTGASTDTIAAAYVAVRDAFRLPAINKAIDQLDAKIPGDLQLELYGIVQNRVISQTIWFARYGDFSKGIAPVISDYQKAIDTLMPKLEKIVPDFLRERIDADCARFKEAGVPEQLARTLARLPIAGLIPDILWSANTAGKSLDTAAKTFFSITEIFRIGRMVQAAQEMTVNDYYDGLALDRALQSLHRARRDIVVDVLKSKGTTDQWMKTNEKAVTRTRDQMSGIVETDKVSVSRLTVAANILADLARE